MKNLSYLFSLALLMVSTQIMAKVKVFSAEAINIQPGGTSELVVKMDYTTQEIVCGYDFSIYLPEGLTFDLPVPLAEAKSSQIKKIITVSSEIHDEEVAKSGLSVNAKTDGGLLVTWIDRDDKTPLISTHGEAMRIAVKASDDFKGGTGKLANIHVCNTNDISLDLYNILDAPFAVNSIPLIQNEDNYLYINDMEGYADTDITLSVNMKNTVLAEGFQFSLVLPDGISVVVDEDGLPEVNLSTARTSSRKTNTFQGDFQDDGTLKVLAATSNGSTISGNDGEVCTIKVHIDKDIAEGDYTIQLKNISVSDTAAVSYDTTVKTSKITVHTYILGDANGDGKIGVADYIAVAHHVLGRTTSNFVEKAADANQDGKVNVADYIAIAHLIMHGTINMSQSRLDTNRSSSDFSQQDNTIYIDPTEAHPGSELTLSVRMKNVVEAEGFQFLLVLPDDMSVVVDEDGFPEVSLSTERTTARKTNYFESVLNTDGSLQVLAASTNCSPISGNDGEICTIKVAVAHTATAGEHTIQIKDIAIGDGGGVSHDVALSESTITIYKNKEKWGDVNNDGKVDVADISTIIDIMASEARISKDMTGEEQEAEVILTPARSSDE